MKVNLQLRVGAFERYVIANYFGVTGRATRVQVRRFVAAALETGVRDWMLTLKSRQHGTATRLLAARESGPEPRPEDLDRRAGPRQTKLF